MTLDESVDCHGWDMLANTEVFKHDPKRAVPGLQQALRLLLPEGYPQTFWSRVAAIEIQNAVKALKAANTWSFDAFTKQLEAIDAESKGNHLSSAFMAAKELQPYLKINSLRSKQLHLAQAIEESALIYFYLPCAIDGGAAKSMAAAALYCLMIEAGLRVDSGAEPRIIHLGVDGYAQVAQSGGVTEAILNLARKWNIQLGLILQSLSQVDSDLQSVLRTNCQQILFDAYTTPEQEAIMALSRDDYKDESRTLSNPGGLAFGTASSTQKRAPKLTKNELLEVSGKKAEFIGFLKLGDEYREPTRMQVNPAVSKEEHSALKAKPLTRLTAPLESSSEESNAFEATPDPELLKLMDRVRRSFGQD